MARNIPSTHQEGNQTSVFQELGIGFIGNNIASGGSTTINFGESNITSKHNQCLKDLLETDPASIKDHILQLKGDPLENTYEWIFADPNYRQWRDNDNPSLLSIKAGPGKGKTMLICSIIAQIRREAPDPSHPISYFFCQASEPKLSSATAVLRGLVFLLMKQDPSLWCHIPSEYDFQGRDLFEGKGAFNILSKTLTAMLRDQRLKRAILVIDALDECTEDLKYLLTFISKASQTLPAKWLVSSREWPIIHDKLEAVPEQITLCLDNNPASVSAVDIYVRHKVELLAKEKHYSEDLASQVLSQLEAKAGTTFLWVALVCQELEDVARTKAVETLNKFPEGLDALYDRMITQLHDKKIPHLCPQILRLLVVAYQPLSLQELAGLLQIALQPTEDLLELIIQCGSFLTVKNNVVYFIHQSAKDFLTQSTRKLGSKDLAELHMTAAIQTLQLLKSSLHYNMYRIDHPGTLIQEVLVPHPDPLDSCRYSCIYWAHHLFDSARPLVFRDSTLISALIQFFEERFVYWLEALSLLRKIPNGVLVMRQLEAWTTIQASQAPLGQSTIMDIPLHTRTNTPKDLIYDAFRFIWSYKNIIAGAPLQAYASALVFSPSQSIVKNMFAKDIPKWIQVKPDVEKHWGPFFHNLEGHSKDVCAMALSMNGHLLASGSYDNTVKIWDLESGACLLTLANQTNRGLSLAFWDGEGRRLLAAGSNDATIKIWDVQEGRCVCTFQGDDEFLLSIAFSPRQDKPFLASSGRSNAIDIWDVDTGIKMHTLHGHSDAVPSLAFSPAKAGQLLASGSWDSTIRIWDTFENIHIQTLNHGEYVDKAHKVAFIPSDGDLLLASAVRGEVKIWRVDPDIYHCTCLHTLKPDGYLDSLSFSRNGQLACGNGSMVEIWNAYHGTHLKTIRGDSSLIGTVVLSPDSRLVIGAERGGQIRVWDVDVVQAHSSSQNQDFGSFISLTPLNNGLVAGSGVGSQIPIWDATNREPVRTISVDHMGYKILAHCPTTNLLASSSDSAKGEVQIWDPVTGVSVNRIEIGDEVVALEYSGDGLRLAVSTYEAIKVWDIRRGVLLEPPQKPEEVHAICLSSDGAFLAFYDQQKLHIWILDQHKYLCDPKALGIKDDEYSHDKILFSNNDQYIALCWGWHVQVWNVETSTCLLNFTTPKLLQQLQFNYHNTRLSTEYGYINLSLPHEDCLSVGGNVIEQARFSGYGIGFDRSWLMKDGRRLVRLPTKYQSHPWFNKPSYIIQDSAIIIATPLCGLYRLILDWNNE